MGRVNTPKIDFKVLEELERNYRGSSNHSFRKRCQTILLKAAGRTSKDVGGIVGMSHVSVNSWLKRFNTEGISGLYIKQGRGRRSIINQEDDEVFILESVKKHRQSVSQAKAEWESFSGKKADEITFKRFLKSLVEDING
jgi:transposase